MPDSSLKFGTSGLRGLAAELVGAASARYTLAFIAHLASRGEATLGSQLLVGRDLRASSPEIAHTVMRAARAEGLLPVDCGALPTPALALESQRLGAPAIMVTGSHIPADRNGLKFYTATGEIEKADEAGIVAALAEVDVGGLTQTEFAPDQSEALAHYAGRYRGLLPDGGLAGMRIGVYQHSSVARDLLVSVLADVGAAILPLGRSEAFVPVDTEAVSADDAERAVLWVRTSHLNALVSTDGDADRPLVADENGAFIRGDILGLLTAQFLGADAVVTPITSNSAIEAAGLFERVLRTRVGSPYVIAGMNAARQAGAAVVVGFEANGGVLLGSDVLVNGRTLPALPTRDALLPILSVLALAHRQKRTLSELVATLPPRFARSDRLANVPPEPTVALLANLRDDLDYAALFFGEIGLIEDVSTIDGLRFTMESGEIVHYRPSGNAPELRCYTEADTPQRAEALLRWGLNAADRVLRG